MGKVIILITTFIACVCLTYVALMADFGDYCLHLVDVYSCKKWNVTKLMMLIFIGLFYGFVSGFIVKKIIIKIASAFKSSSSN
ncbi:hypothetical protein [Photobacterium galatheae]|uniref:Uncharacterized protein n=1 Tax=Photobacterium galatheae TaxID=1654360 RepID=A0A066RUQ3_9GAMM|nr:hypothetical protein [Photobacterium galatheae]KDM91437.1 hypothetical protein EA58_10430 [Photobacterium galatheae]MCM0149509.1 hypothetical protein [Photobacterium galatheae]